MKLWAFELVVNLGGIDKFLFLWVFLFFVKRKLNFKCVHHLLLLVSRKNTGSRVINELKRKHGNPISEIEERAVRRSVFDYIELNIKADSTKNSLLLSVFADWK